MSVLEGVESGLEPSADFSSEDETLVVYLHLDVVVHHELGVLHLVNLAQDEQLVGLLVYVEVDNERIVGVF